MTNPTAPVPSPQGRVRRRRRLALLAGAGLVAAPLAAVGPPALAASGPARTGALTSAFSAAPVGALTPRGCAGTGTVTCDLYAMAGTTSLAGSPLLPIWGFSTTGAPASATAPGPVLVVTEGDTVTVTLHNELAGQDVSLALPGQTGVTHGGTLGDDRVGASTGQTTSYTFTAGRAGTFLYEAGHTAQGARQVAMGLAGALVVLPKTGGAYGATYQDEAVLVLSEVDPALNAAPATFDMRGFAPRYQLVNGKPFPVSDPVSTDQGRTVLLRYVNVGAQTHSMSLLGADQTRVAGDGHALRFPEGEVTEPVHPGETSDTLVTMPTGPEAKVTVYDAAQALDNDHQSTGDPLQTAFGGMMTFLDTNAPPPSTDGVGPVSTHLAVAPNPSDGKADVTVTADVTDALSDVTQAEYLVDDSSDHALDVGPGFGTPMTGVLGGRSARFTGTIPVSALAALDAGKHLVYVRGLDAAGNWGVVGSVVLNLPKTGPLTTAGSVADSPANGASDVALTATGDDSAAAGTITAAEYFTDTVGADGSGTPMHLNRTATVVSEDAVLPAATVKALGEGPHHLFVHSHDSLGLWGPTLDVDLPVDLTGPGVDAVSVAPNPSNGVLSDRSNPGYLIVSAQMTDRDAGGAVQNPLVAAEGFLNPKASPAGGSGFQLLAVDGRFDSTTEAVYGLVPLSQVRALANGTWHVAVRGKDTAGNWGELNLVDLYVDKTAPVLGALTASPSPYLAGAPLTLTASLTDLPLITPQGAQYNGAETWFGTTDPGAGKGTPATFSVVGSTVTVTVTNPAVAGPVQVNLRVQDKAGSWSKASSVTIQVTRPTAVFANAFDANSLAGWSSVTGPNASAVAAAGMPTGTSGLQVSYAAGLPKAASYVTDTSPAAETAYHAGFWMNPSTLSAGTNPLTVFEGQTATGGAVFAVQLRRNGTGANAAVQLRTVLSRTGAGNLTGAWVTLATGARYVKVDWTSGPANGAGAGRVTVSAGTTATTTATLQTQSGNTSGLRVETVRLGVTAGVTAATTGQIWFDGFSSTR